MTSIAVHHMALGCKDPLAVERFYNTHFGFERARALPVGDGQIIFIRSGHTYLELFPCSQDSPLPPPSADGPQYPGWRHLAFKVDNVDAKLAEMGGDAKITLGPLDFDDFIPGWRTVWVADPEGNILEISQGYTDQEQPAAGGAG